MKKIIALAGALVIVAGACSSSTETSTTVATTAPTSTVATTTTTTTPPPTTTVPATTTTTVGPGDTGPDVDAIASAYEIVFSSETTFEEKEPLIDDPTGLEETVAKYQETGASMGGVALEAKSITINGDTADVTYDLLFGGNPMYPNRKGDAILIDGTWKVTREMFCSIMDSARVGCP